VFNSITGKFADESSDYQVLDVPRVASAAYITEDGAELPLAMQLNATTFTGQAQQIEAQQMRDARQGLRVSLACNMRADPVEWGDTLLVSLARFGWVQKPFEVLETNYSLEGGVLLSLKEASSTVFDLGTTFAAADPAPNTFLPSPFVVPDITGLGVLSDSTVQVRNADGTVVQRMRVSWAALADPGVLGSGGGVEVRYGRPGQAEALWISETAEGKSTLIDISGVQAGQLYYIKARAFNLLCAGKWSATAKHTTGTRAISIDTAQLAPNAVAQAVYSGPVSLTGSWVRGAVDLFSDYRHVVVQASWTNTTGGSVDVEYSAELGGQMTSGPGSVRLFAYSSYTSINNGNFTNGDALPYMTNVSAGFARHLTNHVVPVAAGQTLYVAAMLIVSTPNSTTTAYSASSALAKIVALKR
jgi:hypothetical protein